MEDGSIVRRAGIALALGVTALAAAAAPAVAEPVAIAGGEGDWGVKLSFRSYVEGPIAHGEITVADGAVRNDDGTVRFPVVSGTHDSEAAMAEVVLGGSVRFTGHDEGDGPMLDLTIARPRLILDGDQGTLHADVTSLALEASEPTEYPDVDFAALDLGDVVPDVTEEGAVWASIPASLTENGAEAFSGFYDAGTELDPVSVAVAYASDAPVRPPAIAAVKRANVGGGGPVRIATLRCRSGPCAVQAPGRARLRVGGKALRARVVVPNAIGEQASKQARIRLKPKQRQRVKRQGKGLATVRITVRSGAVRQSKVVRTTLRGGGR